jgi:hypothetical protein
MNDVRSQLPQGRPKGVTLTTIRSARDDDRSDVNPGASEWRRKRVIISPLVDHGKDPDLVTASALANGQRLDDALEAARVRWGEQVNDSHGLTGSAPRTGVIAAA